MYVVLDGNTNTQLIITQRNGICQNTWYIACCLCTAPTKDEQVVLETSRDH
jgi:hypothetical protein